MGGNKYIVDNDTTTSSHCAVAKEKPPKDAKDIKDCGCYTIIHEYESDRVWVSYTYSTKVYYLCVNHIKSRNDTAGCSSKA